MIDTCYRRDIRCEDVLIAHPSIAPLDLEEVKKQRRFTSTAYDTLFDMWIGAAGQQFQKETGLQLLTATRMFTLERCPCQREIEFRRAPVQSIVSIEYVGSDGVLATMDDADYEVFPSTPPLDDVTPGGVKLVDGASWPSSVDAADAVRITYTAGFGDAPGAVPELIVYALMQYVGDFHRFSENQTEKSTSTMPIGSQMVVRHASGMMRSNRRMTRW